VGHLQAKGFHIKSKQTTVSQLNAIKEKYGVPRRLRSCHTGIVEGYVIEGHVPGEHVLRLVREKPAVVGIAVPGMPVGSPGMEGPNPKAYDVLSFDRKGRVQVYAHVEP
jgi:hypothetical protein